MNIPRPVSRIFVNGDVLYGLFDRPQFTMRELSYWLGKTEKTVSAMLKRAELEQVIARRLEQIPKIDVKARLRVLAEFVEFAEIIRLNVGAKTPDKGE